MSASRLIAALTPKQVEQHEPRGEQNGIDQGSHGQQP
jgi:hypothetical protein